MTAQWNPQLTYQQYQLQPLYAVTCDKGAPDVSSTPSCVRDWKTHWKQPVSAVLTASRALAHELTYQQYQLQQLYAVTCDKGAPDVSSTPSCVRDWKTHWKQPVSPVLTASRALACGVRHQSTDLRNSKSPICSTTLDALEFLVFFTHCPWGKIGRNSKQNVMLSSCLCEIECGVDHSSACVDSQE
ncbi:hypothetical protein Efla_007650 [Eimeria flavescens]